MLIRLFRSLLPALTIAILALPILSNHHGKHFFLLELFSHFAVQYVVIAGLLAAFWLGQKRWLLVLVALLAIFYNGISCWSLLTVTPPPPTNRLPDLRVLHANVLYTRDDYRPLIDSILHLRPDFFVLQEMTPAGVQAVASLRREYPYQDSVWAKGPCFILVGSRTPFTVDSAARQLYRVIQLTSRVREKQVSLITVHPRTPILPSWFQQRNDQLDFVAGQLASATTPTVLIGDFNISPFSPVYQQTFGFGSARNSSFQACRDRFGWTPTWPRFLPLLFIPIDHAFVNHTFQTVGFRTLSTPGSDHRGLLVDLNYR